MVTLDAECHHITVEAKSQSACDQLARFAVCSAGI